ncbi:hypothetical protein PHMEG_00018744 [Phytophthora megakarya]|uniref:Uncharacterized protein n=1 Tax=Phytophthora megakarya TaxID=4795 RepID=A0A225VUU7_9STRA|nr:hypothetical protein PHMEG_00018744 [Phytophthora megakarya]
MPSVRRFEDPVLLAPKVTFCDVHNMIHQIINARHGDDGVEQILMRSLWEGLRNEVMMPHDSWTTITFPEVMKSDSPSNTNESRFKLGSCMVHNKYLY